MYDQFNNNMNNASLQALYRAQIAGIVFAPASRTDGNIRLRSNPRNLYTYLILFAVVLASPLFYLFCFGDTHLVFTIVSFLPALLVGALCVTTVLKLQTILINENEITVKRALRRKRDYTYDRISSMNCFPPANVSGRFTGNVPLQNIMVLTFDDKRALKLPVMIPGYADLFAIFSARTGFESEIAKIVQFYYRLGIDIKNRRVVQENVFPGMDGQGPSEGGDGAGEGSQGGGQGSDPSNPFDGF